MKSFDTNITSTKIVRNALGCAPKLTFQLKERLLYSNLTKHPTNNNTNIGRVGYVYPLGKILSGRCLYGKNLFPSVHFRSQTYRLSPVYAALLSKNEMLVYQNVLK